MPKRSREADGPVQNKRRSKRLSTKQNDNAEHVQPTQECKLFALPAELRNSMYEMVLIQDTSIDVTVDTRLPALLRVSKQIRVEALIMWHEGNTFEFMITKCNASLLCSWLRLRRAHRIKAIKATMEFDEIPDWSNLMAWCKAICVDHCNAVTPDPDGEGFIGIVVSATSIALRLAEYGRSWEECEKVLNELRYMAGIQNRAWLD
ncbi:hypothetical protein LTR56_006864 [Elasticomyces elasticus]|nr:hypothetical protein LTR22_016697 [Elasticomyces elasticus]KAK3649388.1 hypothetical protein LTR56_006864 [Elasticomyces elasticus]KAK4903801.1 hypothetical protein LTR49_026647 [Elasticomyces elasticus]KAK5748299.1 hypothetical protein LTS12_021638 [Elasticomyces elasticus]